MAGAWLQSPRWLPDGVPHAGMVACVVGVRRDGCAACQPRRHVAIHRARQQVLYLSGPQFGGNVLSSHNLIRPIFILPPPPINRVSLCGQTGQVAGLHTGTHHLQANPAMAHAAHSTQDPATDKHWHEIHSSLSTPATGKHQQDT